jgi:hypothetical protein
MAMMPTTMATTSDCDGYALLSVIRNELTYCDCELHSWRIRGGRTQAVEAVEMHLERR